MKSFTKILFALAGIFAFNSNYTQEYDQDSKAMADITIDEAYEILGTTKESSLEEHRKAFRKRALALHPDKNPGPDSDAQMAKLNTAIRIFKGELMPRPSQPAQPEQSNTTNFQAQQTSTKEAPKQSSRTTSHNESSSSHSPRSKYKDTYTLEECDKLSDGDYRLLEKLFESVRNGNREFVQKFETTILRSKADRYDDLWNAYHNNKIMLFHAALRYAQQDQHPGESVSEYYNNYLKIIQIIGSNDPVLWSTAYKKTGNTGLHAALLTGIPELVSEVRDHYILKEDHDLNKVNNRGESEQDLINNSPADIKRLFEDSWNSRPYIRLPLSTIDKNKLLISLAEIYGDPHELAPGYGKKYIEVITELLNSGADVNYINERKSALGSACWWDHKEIVALILTKKPTIVALPDHNKNTILHSLTFNCKANAVNIAQQIIEAGGSVNATNGSSETPLHTLLSAKNLQEERIQRAVPFVKLLLENKASVNARDSRLRTPRFKVAEWPIEFQSNSNTQNILQMLKDAENASQESTTISASAATLGATAISNVSSWGSSLWSQVSGQK